MILPSVSEVLISTRGYDNDNEVNARQNRQDLHQIQNSQTILQRHNSQDHIKQEPSRPEVLRQTLQIHSSYEGCRQDIPQVVQRGQPRLAQYNSQQAHPHQQNQINLPNQVMVRQTSYIETEQFQPQFKLAPPLIAHPQSSLPGRVANDEQPLHFQPRQQHQLPHMPFPSQIPSMPMLYQRRVTEPTIPKDSISPLNPYNQHHMNDQVHLQSLGSPYYLVQLESPELKYYYGPAHQHVQYMQQPYQTQPQATKRRNVKSRTKTGCLTCRKRRIKCDERKPGCENCQRSKKICMGYEDPLGKRSKRDTLLDLPKKDEYRVYDGYIVKSAEDIPNVNGSYLNLQSSYVKMYC